MAHEVETMMYAGVTPWHGLGHYVGDVDVDSKTAIEKSGLDWLVQKTPIRTEAGKVIETHSAIVRATDGAVLGVVGSKYQPVQNVETFALLDSLVADGSMRYHTAGSLRGGKRVWLLGKIGSFELVPKDKIDQFIFAWNAHDGSGSFRLLFTTTRVVCANTARVALDNRDGIYLKHTRNIGDRIQQAREVLGIARQEHSEFESFAQMAANKSMTPGNMADVLNAVLPEKYDETERAKETRKKTAVQIVDLYFNGIGQDIPGVQQTGWAAYNAVVEFANYHRRAVQKTADERRFESTLFGDSADMIDRAKQAIIQIAA